MSTGFLGLPSALDPSRDSLRRIANVVNGILQGRQNNVGTLTLSANVASTTITGEQRVGASTHISFTPTSANAAAEIGAGTMYVSARGKSTYTVTHANNAQTDRTFTVEFSGVAAMAAVDYSVLSLQALQQLAQGGDTMARDSLVQRLHARIGGGAVQPPAFPFPPSGMPQPAAPTGPSPAGLLSGAMGDGMQAQMPNPPPPQAPATAGWLPQGLGSPPEMYPAAASQGPAGGPPPPDQGWQPFSPPMPPSMRSSPSPAMASLGNPPQMTPPGSPAMGPGTTAAPSAGLLLAPRKPPAPAAGTKVGAGKKRVPSQGLLSQSDILNWQQVAAHGGVVPPAIRSLLGAA